MRAVILVAAVMLCSGLRVGAVPQTRTDGTRVHWYPSREAAQVVARATHKPVLLLQMFGRLDEELC
jgi:hypothetical protein